MSFDVTSVSVVAGSITPTVTLQISPMNGFSGTVLLSGQLPAGFHCFSNSCNGTPSNLNYLVLVSFTTSPSLDAGTYPITITGTSGSLTHQITVNVTINPFPAITPNQSAFVFTGDPFQRSVLNDPVRNVVYAPDMQHNLVHVLSIFPFKIIHDISVPSPVGLDLSADGTLLYVGSNTQYLYVIDPGLMRVIDRVHIPNSTIQTIFPNGVATLSNGSVMLRLGCGVINACTTASSLAIYNPTTRSFSFPNPPGLFFSEGVMTRSSDHSAVFIGSSDSGGSVARYDVQSDSFTGQQIQFGNFLNSIAVSPDNSSFAVILNCCEVDLYDSSFNQKASFKDQQFFLGGLLYSPDSARIYVPEGTPGRVIRVLDAKTLNSLGLIPNLEADGASGSATLSDWNGSNRLLGYSDNGVEIVDASMAPTALPAAAPIWKAGPGINATFTPDNDAHGLNTIFNGVFNETPVITFNGVPAGNVLLNDLNTISLKAPALSGINQADVIATFPSGYFLLAPAAYSYAPTILYADGDASGNQGGGKIRLYGYGFDFAPSQIQVSIGGNAANVQSVDWVAGDPFPTPLYSVTVTVPAGIAGEADIRLTTPIGTTTMPAGFHYAARFDFAVPAGSSPFQMIQDKARNRLYWTDTNSGTLVVFSTLSNTVVQQIHVGKLPAGLSLTPDGSKLLVISAGDSKLTVFDPNSFAVVQQFTNFVFDPGLQSLSPEPLRITAVANNKAFVLATINGYGCLPIFQYDIAGNSVSTRTDAGFCPSDESGQLAGSADGNYALAGSMIWSAATDTFTPLTVGNDFSPRATNADGLVFATYRAFHLRDGSRAGIASAENLLLMDIDFNQTSGEKLNASGSLLYLPETDRIRIFDVQHGNLVNTLTIPDGVLPGTDGLALDPSGNQLWIMTNSGLSSFTFVAEPLSIGEVQVANSMITILGSGFQPGAQVLVDGIPVSTQSIDANTLTAVDGGLSSGQHQVTVSVPGRQPYTLDDAFSVP